MRVSAVGRAALQAGSNRWNPRITPIISEASPARVELVLGGVIRNDAVALDPNASRATRDAGSWPVTSLGAQHRYGWRWGYSGSADTLEITRLDPTETSRPFGQLLEEPLAAPLIPLSVPDTSGCHA